MLEKWLIEGELGQASAVLDSSSSRGTTALTRTRYAIDLEIPFSFAA